jgi:DNA-binding transcriptional ArsR family regulator
MSIASGLMLEGLPPLGPKRIEAFADETRVEILQLLNHRLASTSELARELRISESRVEYHVNVLIECDCIEVAATRKRDGRATPFYTAKPGTLLPPSPLKPLVEQEPVTKAAMQAFACRAGSALDAGAANDTATSAFAVETLTLTAPHRLNAIHSLRLTVGSLRALHEQSRQLRIATDTQLIPVEVGIAMFEPLRSEDE